MGITDRTTAPRLLVITYHFPPDGAIGGQRWAGLSKYLARLGWEVHVVTASPGPANDTPGVYRHHCARRRTLNDFYKTASRHFRPRAHTNFSAEPEARSRSWVFRLIAPLTALRRILGSSMYLPDEGRGWITAAASTARALLRKETFNIVVTSGPPHSAHFAGIAAVGGRSVPLWIDMRDPWSITYGSRPSDDWFAGTERLLMRQLERVVLRRADRVIVNTPKFAGALGDAEHGLEVICIQNGVDLEQVPQRDVGTVENGLIVYVGTLYFGRNLSTICSAMRRLLDDRPEGVKHLSLHVAGPMEAPHRRQFEADVAAAQLTSVVTNHGSIPREGAIELLGRSALALVLAQGQPMQVPAKLYESVALGVPTLVIAEQGSAAAREAERVGAMTLEDGDVEGVRALLENLLDGNIAPRIIPKASIAYEDLARKWDRLFRDSLGLPSEAVHVSHLEKTDTP